MSPAEGATFAMLGKFLVQHVDHRNALKAIMIENVPPMAAVSSSRERRGTEDHLTRCCTVN